MDPVIYLAALRVVGLLSLFAMIFTGKQGGGRKLHMVYRLMLACIFLIVAISFFVAR